MRLQSKRAQAEQARAMTILRGKLRDLQNEVRKVTDANKILAQRLDLSDSALIVEAASLRDTNRAHLERRRRLEEQVEVLRAERDQARQEVEALRKDRDGVRAQLDDALGYQNDGINPLFSAVTSR
jgi:50S ribosomal subunit-associated GTPase HflX